MLRAMRSCEKRKPRSVGQQHRLTRRGLEHFADAIPVQARDPRQRRGVDSRRQHGGPAQHLAAVDVEARQALLNELVKRVSAIAGGLGACQLDGKQRIVRRTACSSDRCWPAARAP